MKKIFVLLFVMLSSICYGQDILLSNMLNLAGQPKRTTSYSLTTNKPLILEFSKEGKITYSKNQFSEIKYTWENDNSQILCELLDNGKVLNKAYIYINSFDEFHINYDVIKNNIDVVFNENHTIKKITSRNEEAPQMNYEINYEYDNDCLYPSIIKKTFYGETVISKIEPLLIDKKGNVIKSSTSANGQTLIESLKIEYY